MVGMIVLLPLFCALFVAVCTGHKKEIEAYQIQASGLRDEVEYYRKRAIDIEGHNKDLEQKIYTITESHTQMAATLKKTQEQLRQQEEAVKEKPPEPAASPDGIVKNTQKAKNPKAAKKTVKDKK